MTQGFLSCCLLQWFFFKVVTSQMAATKYIQMGNMCPVRPNVPTLPSVPMQYPPNPTITSLLNNYLPNYPSLPLPFTNQPPMVQMSPQMNLPSFTNIPPMPMTPPLNPLLPLPLKSPAPSTLLDPIVMNNLAIALHLLILNNLLNPEQDASKQSVPPENPPQPPSTQTCPQNSQPAPTIYPSQPQNYFPEPQDSQTFPPTPPNYKFLGSSGFAEPLPPSMLGASAHMPLHNKAPRNSHSHSLKSPYEAIGPGPQAPGQDVFAQYGPQNLKADFQSPYNAIMASDNANTDLFSMF